MKTILKQINGRKLLALGSAVLLSAVVSCSDEPLESNPQGVDDIQTPQLTFAHQEGDLVILNEDKSNGLEASRSTRAGGPDRGRFNIDLNFVFPVTERQQAVFESAAARWEEIIIKDVSSVTGTIPSAFTGLPPIAQGTTDDIVIEVVLFPLDGPGGTLGQAGPRFIRFADDLPVSGVMLFDTADLELLERFDLFEDVIVHEMGHVLGVGTLWNFRRELLQGPVENPYFAGRMANVHWNAEGGLDELPIENMGGPGTALGHWRESILRNELMTGFINLGENPLSRITAGSMKDLGYGAAVRGEQYDLPKGAPGVDIDELAAMEGQGINIAAMEELLEPIGIFISQD